MRVNLVVSPYEMCGLSRYALELSESLPKLGLDVNTIEARPPGWLRRANGMVKRLGPDLSTFWGTYPVQLPMKDDQIYHLTHPGLATSLYLSRASRVVVTVHDIIHYVYRHDRELSTYQHRLQQKADELGLRALHKASAIIAISEYTKAALVEHLDLPAEKIHVVHRSVNLERFRPQEVEDSFWVRHGLDRNCRYVMHLSSEEPRKNVPTLIRAFAQVVREWPEARLLKIGRSQYPGNRRRLIELVRELGIEDKVTFIDYVSDEDLPRFYNIAEVFVLPSLYEGFGLPALEAMACGCPVICSDRPPLSNEIVGQAGWLIDPLNDVGISKAVGFALENGQTKAECRSAGLETAARFSSMVEAERTRDVFRSI